MPDLIYNTPNYSTNQSLELTQSYSAPIQASRIILVDKILDHKNDIRKKGDKSKLRFTAVTKVGSKVRDVDVDDVLGSPQALAPYFKKAWGKRPRK